MKDKINEESAYPLGRLKEVVKKWLYLEDDRIVDVMLAAHIANRFSTDPLWMIIIAPPSSAKTELLRSLNGDPNVYFLSNLTPSTLVSGIKPTKADPQPSLLPKLDGKTLILKDFTTVLSMRSESQQEILSQLREVYDGQYSKAFGNGVRINWNGRVGLLAACTPVYDKHYGVIGTMGDRFLLFRAQNSDSESIGTHAQRTVGHEDEMREEMKNAVQRFLEQFKDIDGIKFKEDENISKMIVILAVFCAHARCTVERDYRNRNILYTPAPEGPARLTKQFMQLGMALALVHGKRIIDEDIYGILKKVGQDLVSTQRISIIKHLWDNGIIEDMSLWHKTKEISDEIAIPGATTLMVCEDLMLVGLLNRDRSGDKDNSPYTWQLNKRACGLIERARIFDSGKEVIPF